MKNIIYQSEVVTMENLNNLFIEMTSKFCNQRCKHCYIDFPKYKKVEDFIDVDIIKNGLNDTVKNDIKCIYLTGAEPMTHPDFNVILRLCLKRCDVCICTNGSFINEKKARFLKKVADETTNEIIFKISIDHYEELKNDEIRYRGAFRHGLFALKYLSKYNFNPIITVTNYYNEPEEILCKNFLKVFENYGIETDKAHIHIIPWYDKNSIEMEKFDIHTGKVDCENGRILTSKGVYTCPFLAGDYRGRCGSSLNDYTKKCALETSFCQICLKSKKQIFGIDFKEFAIS
ncbi:radical SAM protein [bacterium]|nr:radical SAM protein [bacterium]